MTTTILPCVLPCVIFSIQWCFSTLFSFWLTRARGQNVVWRNLQIASKSPRNWLSLATTTTANMKNYNKNYHINNLANDSDLVSSVIDNTTNCVKDNECTKIYNYWFLFIQKLYVKHCAQPFNHFLTYSLNVGPPYDFYWDWRWNY